MSQVVLRRWAVDGYLEELNVQHPASGWRRRSPAAAGYVRDYVRADAARVEQVWKDVEDRLPAALAELDAGGAVLAGSDTERAVQDCLALHWARSKAVKDTADTAVEKVRERTRAKVAARPDLLDLGFRQTTGGLHPAGPEARAIALDRLTEGPPEVLDGTHFAARVVQFYEAARLRFGGYRLHVYDCAPQAPDLVVSDGPVVAPGRGSGLSPRDGVALGETTSVSMPLGPLVAVSLHPQAERRIIDAGQADMLNRLQEHAADRCLYRRSPRGGTCGDASGSQ